LCNSFIFRRIYFWKDLICKAEEIVEKKFCRETGQGELLNALKLNNQINSLDKLDKNDELGFYRFTEIC